MDEFALIRRLFAPLATSEGAAGLGDDVAILASPGNGAVIVTTDAIVEGVHFLTSDPLDTVARKLVRVNVSDIIAKGGRPFAASLTLVWPNGREADELQEFAAGLGEDLEKWGVRLIGGDTTSTPGPLTLSMTMHGHCPGADGPVRRSGARIGDLVAVSGVIGRGWLGLRAARGELPEEAARIWLPAYQEPDIQGLDIADLVARVASSSIDVSDGLLADAGHIAEQSKARLQLRLDRIPLALGVDGEDEAQVMEMLTGGDDYQVLFTLAPDDEHELRRSGLELTVIGDVVSGEGVDLFRADGSVVDVAKGGWTHF